MTLLDWFVKPRASLDAEKRLSNPKPIFTATLNQSGRNLNQPELYRRPTMQQLLRRYFRWAHRCITINAQTAASVKPCLFAIGNKGVVEKSLHLKPRPVSKRMRHYLNNGKELKPGSVAQKKLQGNLDDLTEITEHPALMLLDNVNEWEEGFGFREMLYSDLQLFGRSFTSIVADTSDVPIALWRMLPHFCEVLPSTSGGPAGFKYGIAPNDITLAPDEVFWIKLADVSNPWGGMSPTEAWLKSIDAENAMVAFQEWIFNRGGTPDVLISMKGTMDDPQKQALRKDWRKMFGNMANREESVAILSGDEIEVHELGGRPRDMEYQKGRELSRDEICNGYGVPKALYTTDDVNLANAAQGSITYQRHTIWPMITRVEDAINQRMLDRWSDRLIIIHDNPVQEDKAIRIQEDESDLRTGVATPNELRLRRGEEESDDPGMNARYISSDLVPLSMAGMSAMGSLMATPGMDAAMPPDAESPDAAQPGAVAPVPGQEPLAPNETLPQGVEAGQIQTTEAMVLNGAQIASGREIVAQVANGDIPRDAGIGQLIVFFNLTPAQAEQVMGSAGTGVATTPNENPKETAQQEADLAAAEAQAAGRMNANGRGSGNADKSAGSGRRGSDGAGVQARQHTKAGAADSESEQLQGDTNEGVDRASGAGETQRTERDRDDFAGGVDGNDHQHVHLLDSRSVAASHCGTDGHYSQQSQLFKAWNGVEHECNSGSDVSLRVHAGGGDGDGIRLHRPGNGGLDSGDVSSRREGLHASNVQPFVSDSFLGKCYTLHLKADSPQEDLPESGSVRGFKKNINKTLRDQVDAMLEALAFAELNGFTPNAATVRAVQVISQPEWVERIQTASRPFLQRATDIGGKFGMEKLTQIKPDLAMGFDVTNPEVQRHIDNYNVRLANGINQSTEVAARDLLGKGLEEGKSIPELTKSVQDWAGEAGDATRGTEARAENIARTESARAYVKGEQEAWKQSDVVQGKAWLLAPDACSFCEAASKAFDSKPIGLNQNFFAKGSTVTDAEGKTMNLDYADVDGPPLHPQCRCDLIPVLEGE